MNDPDRLREPTTQSFLETTTTPTDPCALCLRVRPPPLPEVGHPSRNYLENFVWNKNSTCAKCAYDYYKSLDSINEKFTANQQKALGAVVAFSAEVSSAQDRKNLDKKLYCFSLLLPCLLFITR